MWRTLWRRCLAAHGGVLQPFPPVTPLRHARGRPERHHETPLNADGMLHNALVPPATSSSNLLSNMLFRGVNISSDCLLSIHSVKETIAKDLPSLAPPPPPDTTLSHPTLLRAHQRMWYWHCHSEETKYLSLIVKVSVNSSR